MELSDILIYSGQLPLELILWSFYIAIVIATFVMYITKVKFGKLIYALLEKGATTPETALRIDETGIKCGIFIKLSLKNHLHYKDMLVAITSEGKYYANTFLTDEPPVLRELKAITRKKRSRIKEKAAPSTDSVSEAEQNSTLSAPACNENKNIEPENAVVDRIPEASAELISEELSCNETEESPEAPSDLAGDNGTSLKPQRVNFDTQSAKYYIPEQVHAKVMSIFNDKGTKLRYIILLLIALGVLTYFATFVTEGLIDMFENIGSK